MLVMVVMVGGERGMLNLVARRIVAFERSGDDANANACCVLLSDVLCGDGW